MRASSKPLFAQAKLRRERGSGVFAMRGYKVVCMIVVKKLGGCLHDTEQLGYLKMIQAVNSPC